MPENAQGQGGNSGRLPERPERVQQISKALDQTLIIAGVLEIAEKLLALAGSADPTTMVLVAGSALKVTEVVLRAWKFRH
ncbi:hypothetical protein ACTOB_003767 [Actinoplanes oblitus]|uniref:Uncharacterized protein n=1 Tax=Actinoplanes oblitus TaxID=3040509 RepID=A0ABY8WT84_9ACTN|nr:hypothetical protein [Actinoplanes oblitus]WIN00086.1 hypothetical protein ACTOB_003767 [Actinoplanes oblitus]